MTQAFYNEYPQEYPHPPGRPVLLVLLICVMAGLLLAGNYWYFPSRIGQRQPIPFSHAFHAGKKQIGCLVCHPQAINNSTAGLPALETCMLCHRQIAIHYPWIERLRTYYEHGSSIRWKRISELPDYVYFPHDMHLLRQIDCGHCHGDVKSMDRLVQAQEFKMGFCIGCHRDYGVTHDCFTCHR